MRTIEISQELPQEAQLALGYLTMWGLEGYNKVCIYPDSSLGQNGIIAHYTDEVSGNRYTIGAVFNTSTKQYSFHS